MRLELSTEQAQALKTALDTYAEELDRVLVRTDKAELQHAIKREVDRLAEVRVTLARALAQEGEGAGASP